ncbi:MAG: MATE family efflux transporter [Bacilli bacterium]|nr:MATE family efflux transporter [Bacilli bacterium]
MNGSNQLEVEPRLIRNDVIKIAWPVLVELLLSSLFSMVDMMMLGWLPDKAESAASVAAVGLTNQPLFIGQSLVQALNVGGTALIARYFGSKETDKIEPVLKHVIMVSLFGLAIPLSIIGFFFAPGILDLLGAKSDTISVGTKYFQILMIGFIFQSFNMSIAASLRGVGETKTPMRINLTANFFNVFGNYILIFGRLGSPKFGITGAGISTALSNMFVTIVLFGVVIKGKGVVKLSIKHRFHFDNLIVYNLIKIGIPATLEQLVLRTGILLFVRIVADLGTVSYATHQISLSILSLSFQPGQAFGIATSALIGKSLGAGQLEHAEAYSKVTRKFGTYISTMMALIFFFFGRYIASLYTRDEEIIQNATVLLKIIALVQPFQASQLILAGGLRGAGDTFWPLVSALVGVLGVRVGLAYLLVNVFNMALIGAWIAIFVDQLIRWAFVFFRFRTGQWKYIKLKE